MQRACQLFNIRRHCSITVQSNVLYDEGEKTRSWIDCILEGRIRQQPPLAWWRGLRSGEREERRRTGCHAKCVSAKKIRGADRRRRSGGAEETPQLLWQILAKHTFFTSRRAAVRGRLCCASHFTFFTKGFEMKLGLS
jgi:hypothetical protein